MRLRRHHRHAARGAAVAVGVAAEKAKGALQFLLRLRRRRWWRHIVLVVVGRRPARIAQPARHRRALAAREQRRERALARAIATLDLPALAGADDPIDAAQQCRVAARERQPAHLDNGRARLKRRRRRVRPESGELGRGWRARRRAAERRGEQSGGVATAAVAGEKLAGCGERRKRLHLRHDFFGAVREQQHLRVRRRRRVDALHQQLAEAGDRHRDELGQAGARRRVEAVKRVVQNEEPRPRAERAREEHLAHLARRDRAHRAVEQRVEPEAHDEVLGRRRKVTERAVHGAALAQQLLVRVERDVARRPRRPAVAEFEASAVQ